MTTPLHDALDEYDAKARECRKALSDGDLSFIAHEVCEAHGLPKSDLQYALAQREMMRGHTGEQDAT